MKSNKEKSKSRFGEILIEDGTITIDQLKKALNRQAQAFGRLGSILVELGYISTESMLSILSRQYSVQGLDLYKIEIPKNILNIIPFEKVKKFHILPIKKDNERICLAMINPNDINAIQDVEFAVGTKITPFVVPDYQMIKLIDMFEKQGYGRKTFYGEVFSDKDVVVESKGQSIYNLLSLAVENNATDLHLTVDVAPSLRINNVLKRLSLPPLTNVQMKGFAKEVLNESQMEEFKRDNEIDFAISLKDIARFRVNMYKQRGSISIAARMLVEDIPSISKLRLPEWIGGVALKRQGIILITGPTGHGKTTTMASLVDLINTNLKSHIITLEDPIEYLHSHKKSNINQREVGIDTDSFAEGLKRVFRQDPDVIVIGEMRDPESVAIALTAAETGHLVISTLHTMNVTTAIDRIVDLFPANQQTQVRNQFSDVFLLIFSQRLVNRKDGKGRILAYEMVSNSFRVRNLIREGKAFNLRSYMQTGSDDMYSIDQSLAKLSLDGEIELEEGLKYADNQEYYRDIVNSGRGHTI